MDKGIYIIENIITGKIYIGSASSFKKRWYSHLYRLNRNNHSNEHLQFSWNKYGHCNFIFKKLEIIEDDKFLLEREQYYLDTILFAQDFINNKNTLFSEKGYNINPTAGNWIGCKHSKETKTKISNNRIGKACGSNNGMFGKTHNTEVKEIISKTHRGKKLSESHKQKISEFSINKKSIVMMDKNNVSLNTFPSILSASKFTGILAQNISELCNNSNPKRKTAGGFKWKFADINFNI